MPFVYYREQKRSKPTGRGRGARRGRGRGRGQQQAPEPQEEPQPETVVEEEKPELQVTKLEEAAQKSLDLPAKSSIPFLEAGELYTQKELAEGVPLASAAEELCTQQETAGATPAGSAVFSMGKDPAICKNECVLPDDLFVDHSPRFV